LSWEKVERQIQIVEDVREEVIGSTETPIESVQANGALTIKQLELIDEYINVECKDEKIRTAFNKYTDITLKLIEDIIIIS
jgi:hypothetical protein